MTTDRLKYRRIFEPGDTALTRDDEGTHGFGDRRETAGYVYTEHITLAINVALATARPLLVRGSAGSGKTTLAVDVARQMEWDLYVEAVSSRTRARDLLWEFDAVQRLGDAQAGDPTDRPDQYIRPGVLWHAFDPSGAARYARHPAGEPRDGAVVLLDEIDKAEPDTPNDLLGPLGTGRFTVTDLEQDVACRRPRQPLVVITTNEERELTSAFTRRCVVLQLPEPDAAWLVQVAAAHFGTTDSALYEQVADYVIDARRRASEIGARPPSTAEYLDTLAACSRLDVAIGGAVWDHVAVTTLAKWLPEPTSDGR